MIRVDRTVVVFLSALALACTQAAEATGQGMIGKILFLGNSITLHPPAPDIEWTGNWGMAASEEAKDYAHLVTAAIGQRTGTTPSILVRNIADFERDYATYDVETLLADAFAFKPDLFVLAIGENVGALDATQFKAGVLRIINGVKAQNSQALILVRSCFWADAAKDLALSQAAQQAGAIFVNIGALGAVESNLARSERAYSPAGAGVGMHPGDRGMAAIASAIVQSLGALGTGEETTLSDMLIGWPRKETLTLAEHSAIATVINAGELVKAGDARLVVTNALLVHGTEEVKAGTLELGDGVGDLPAALQSGLAFWVDANRNVATDESGSVTNWYDVREAAGGALYPRARKFGSELAPTLVTGGADVAGNKLVDFGALSSGKWLQWQDAAGSQYRMSNIRTVFLAVSCTNGAGFLLGDATGYPGGKYCFHVGGTTTDGLDTKWWQAKGGGDDNAVRYGLTRVNGVVIDGGNSLIPRVGTVMSVQTVWNALASNFGNDRNLRAGQWTVPADRQGGGRIGEALIYTSVLSDSQRAQVEAYLMKKWLRKTLGTVRVASGATLAITATNALDLTKVTGAGTLAVAGTGRITLPDTGNIAVPSIALGAGSSASGTLCQHPGQPFVMEGGANYEAASGIHTRTARSDATIASKTGSGVMTVSSLDEAVARVNVAEGILRLAPPLRGVSEVLTGALQNGSFEYQDGSRSPNENGILYLENVPYGSWTFTYGAGGNCGLAHYSGAFCKRQPPEGEWVMFLCNDCTVSQNFTVSVAGRYEVSFDTATAGDANWPWHLYQVLVDGNVVGSIRTSETQFQHVLCRTPALSAGTHTLTFNGIAEANRVSIIDNVEIRPCIEADEVEVPNGGFEVPTVLTEKSSAERPYAYFKTAPEGASWTFSSGIGLYTGTTEGYGTWRYTGMDEGGHAAILCNSSTNKSTSINYGLMSVPLTFPTAGVYRITFKAASRTARYTSYFNQWNDNSALYGNTVAVALNGVEAARPTTPSWLGEFTAYEFVLPPVTNNGSLTQTLAFQMINTDWFATVLVDDVRVFRMPPIQNPGFEDDTAEGRVWTLNNGDGIVTGITTPGNTYWNGAIPEGARSLVMANNGSARQSVTFETSGTYEVSLLASQSHATAPGHEFAVLFDGMLVGSIRSTSTTFQRYAFRLPYVKAGQAYELVLQGLTPGGIWYASLIDSVILRKVVPEPVPLSDKLLADTTLSLAEGAALELDYPGVIEVYECSYGGTPRTGTLSADNTSFIRGAGSVLVKPKGTLITLQ